MERIFIATCLCLGIAVLTTCKEYRSDYEYNEQTDAFYKLHIETLRVGGAQQTCGVEGAKLLQLASAEDAIQVHRMMKNFPDIGDYVWVNDDGQEHESAEEPAIINFEPEESEYTPLDSVMRCEVVTRQGKEESAACYQELPFVCKVSARDAPYNRECNVYGKDYQRAQNVSSCYKIHPMPFTWNQAYAECSAEGAHLVVLNSQAEHDYVHNLMQTSKPVAGSYASWFFLAGFRAEPTTNITTRVFKTIFNETLQEAGFSTWAPNEPNNSKDNENCGTLFRNDGNLNDVDCTLQYGFICEKEVP